METTLDKLLSKLTEHRVKPKRFFTSLVFAVLIALLPIGFTLLDPDAFDYDMPPYQPTTPLENMALVASRTIFVSVDWPMAVAALIGGDRLFFAAFFPLLILTGLFWATFVEWIFIRAWRTHSEPE